MLDESDTDSEPTLENYEEVLDDLMKELQELYSFRDLFFENHPIEMASEKNKCVEEKKVVLVKKFEAIDEAQIPIKRRAEFLFMKGKCYNINTTYDPRATQCLSKAVKLNPRLIDAWNELGECYWKNMNIKEARASFEGALHFERNRTSLRCISILLRQDISNRPRSEANAIILRSVKLAKEAVAKDIKDGVSWSVLGNAYLCQYFMVAQDAGTLRACMSAYKQAWLDPVSKGNPDLYYNRGIALKYDEVYDQALENFDHACRLDPAWEPPKTELTKLQLYLYSANELVQSRGKIKNKKLIHMAQTIDRKFYGFYGVGTHTFGIRRDVTLLPVTFDTLEEGWNEGKVVLGRVIGSINNENAVPFTLALIDENMECMCVTVYNWADGRGAIIGDFITIPEPVLKTCKHDGPLATYDYKSIRVNNPLLLLINGKKVGRHQYASTRVSSTYEIH